MLLQNLKTFCRETRESPSNPDKSPRTFRMTLRDLIDSLEFFDGKDRLVDVFLDSPEEDEIVRVKFAESMNAPTDQPGEQLSTFELSLVRIGDGLPDLRDYATVEVTLDKHDPTKVQLRFRKDEDSGD